MGIHYTYKSIRGEKAMKKEAKRKARLEQRRAKKGSKPITDESEKMHDIEKTISFNEGCIKKRDISFEERISLEIKFKKKKRI